MDERLKRQIRIAQKAWRSVAPVIRELNRSPGMKAAIRSVLQAQEAVAPVVRVLNSPEYRAYTEAVRLHNEIARRRFGQDGLELAERAAMSRLRRPENTRPAVERIRRGEADQIFSEAAELAASAEVRETIEQADRETLLSAAQEAAWTDAETQPVSDVDIEAEDLDLTGEQLDALFFETLQIAQILATAFFAAMAISSPALSPEQIAWALDSILTLLSFIYTARQGRDSS